VTPLGWREAAAPYGEEGAQLSLADVVDPVSLEAVRAARRERKLARKLATRVVDGINSVDAGNENRVRTVTKPSDLPRTTTHVVAGSGVTGVRASG
jgi:hypothetical protein